MSRELQYGDPVTWCEMRPARGRRSKDQALVGITQYGVFRRYAPMGKLGRVAVVATKKGIEHVKAESVTLDEEALAKREASDRGF